MDNSKKIIQPEPIKTITLVNEDGSPLTRKQLINIGFPDLFNPIEQFYNDESTMEKDFYRACKSVFFVEGISYEQYLKTNHNEDLSAFIESEFNEKFKDHNKKYMHQGGYLNNAMSLSALDAVATSPIVGGSITTKGEIQTTTVKSKVEQIILTNIDNDYLYSFKNKNIQIIFPDKEKDTLMNITTKINTDIKEKTSTSFIKIDFFDENALHYYEQCVKRCKQSYKEREIINNIVLNKISKTIEKKESFALIKKINDINPGYGISNKDGQSNYLVVLLKEIKALKNNKILEKPINDILNNLERTIESGKLSTIKQGDLYAAMLKNKIIPNLSASDNKKYDKLYAKGNTKNNILDVLQSYYKAPSFGNFFNKFRHNTDTIKNLELRIRNFQESSYEGKTKEIKEAYRDIIIDEIKKQGHFNGHGEMAKMTGFLVKQLDSEIVELEKKYKNTATMPSSKNS